MIKGGVIEVQAEGINFSSILSQAEETRAGFPRTRKRELHL